MKSSILFYFILFYLFFALIKYFEERFLEKQKQKQKQTFGLLKRVKLHQDILDILQKILNIG